MFVVCLPSTDRDGVKSVASVILRKVSHNLKNTQLGQKNELNKKKSRHKIPVIQIMIYKSYPTSVPTLNIVYST